MAILHDPEVRSSIEKRMFVLRPDTKPKWGRMTVDQMLWHVNVPLLESLGDYSAAPNRVPIPRRLLRWATLNLPWPRGARTRPDLVARAHYDFEQERARCLELIDRVCARDISAPWPSSAGFGEMRGNHWSRLHAKHLDHHLRQFGV